MPFHLPHYKAHQAHLGTTLKQVREYRHLSASEVARRLGLANSSYEDWEHGRTRLTFDHIIQFARVTDTDALAIAAALPFNDNTLAVHCADNKLMTIVATAVHNMHQHMGDDLARLPKEVVIASVEKICGDLIKHMDAQDRFGDAWLARNFRAKVDQRDREATSTGDAHSGPSPAVPPNGSGQK
jgi:transcriptional regulator with XRE-family HTH domain